MKKIISLLLVAVLCIGLVCPVLADEFVPSITDKDAPDIVPVPDGEGKSCIGPLMDGDNNVIDYAYEDCLVITPISEANSSTRIPEDSKATLLDVYAKLSDGTMDLPYEKFNANLDPSTMVIRDLFDASWLCGEGSGFTDHPDHPSILAVPGNTLTVTFDLGISKNATVYVMTYINGVWEPIVKTTNNGDGTVTCVFEDICPIAFSVGSAYTNPPAQTGDNSMVYLWGGLLAVATLALVALIAVPAIKKNRNMQ